MRVAALETKATKASTFRPQCTEHKHKASAESAHGHVRDRRLQRRALYDRSFVCVLQGNTYVLLTVNGYRVVNRDASTVDSEAAATYTQMCALIAETIDKIYQTCNTLDYNVTQDNLRIVDDLDSNKMYLIGQSLPILIMPYWDNCANARVAIPSFDGSECMFRLEGQYVQPTSPFLVLNGVNRTVRQAKTVEWLKRPGGVWRNG